MTDAFKVPVSRNTLSRLIAWVPDPATAVPPRGRLDEYAQRKGRVVGTVLVDVRPVAVRQGSARAAPGRKVQEAGAWRAQSWQTSKRPNLT